MANDIDLWNDIEDLEAQGKADKARDLHNVYRCKYIEYDEQELDAAVQDFIDKYGENPLN